MTKGPGQIRARSSSSSWAGHPAIGWLTTSHGGLLELLNRVCLDNCSQSVSVSSDVGRATNYVGRMFPGCMREAISLFELISFCLLSNKCWSGTCLVWSGLYCLCVCLYVRLLLLLHTCIHCTSILTGLFNGNITAMSDWYSVSFVKWGVLLATKFFPCLYFLSWIHGVIKENWGWVMML